jgi:hypothetical protein
LLVVGIDLRASHLLDKYSITSAMRPVYHFIIKTENRNRKLHQLWGNSKKTMNLKHNMLQIKCLS